MAVLNPREEIVMLLRGYFSCSIINALGKNGILDKMIYSSFTIESFSEIIGKDIFKGILDYFVKLGLLDVDKNNEESVYKVTELGKKIFKRHGSFTLLHSYGPFLDKLEPLLFDPNHQELPTCNRQENVIGSGQANGRKFFPEAIEMIKKIKPSFVADIGCGDGVFLSKAMSELPDINVVASDISKISIKSTKRNLKKKFPEIKIKTILSDATDVEKWAKLISDYTKDIKGSLVISMWYLVHEISQNKEEIVIDFFKKINQFCPKAEIIVGEIVNIPEETSRNYRYTSIMPEFLFFHEISGQGVLSWSQYQNIINQIPYQIVEEVWFDKVVEQGKELPTGFIWHLTPEDLL